MVANFDGLTSSFSQESIDIRLQGISQVKKARDLGEMVVRMQEVYKEDKCHLVTGMRWQEYVRSLDNANLSLRQMSYYKSVYLNWDLIVEKGWDTSKTYSQLVFHVLPNHRRSLKGEEAKDYDGEEAEKILWKRKQHENLLMWKNRAIDAERELETFRAIKRKQDWACQRKGR